MHSGNSNHSKGDPFVISVLDQIFSVSQIDPNFVLPEDRLGKDLGLSRSQIQTVFYEAAEALGISVSCDNSPVEDLSAREIVKLLKAWSNASLGQVA